MRTNVASGTWCFKLVCNTLFNMIVEMELRDYKNPQFSDTMGTGDMSKTQFITKGNTLLCSLYVYGSVHR